MQHNILGEDDPIPEFNEATSKFITGNYFYNITDWHTALKYYLNALLLNPNQNMTDINLKELLETADFHHLNYLPSLKLLMELSTKQLPLSVKCLTDKALANYYLSIEFWEWADHRLLDTRKIFHSLSMLHDDKDKQKIWHAQKHNLMYYACVFGYLDLIGQLIKLDESLLEATLHYGDTPLCFTAKQVSTSKGTNTIKFLLDKGANINQQDTFGDTILHYAIRRNVPTLVNFLLSYGANMHIENKYAVNAINLCINSCLGCGKHDEQGVWHAYSPRFDLLVKLIAYGADLPSLYTPPKDAPPIIYQYKTLKNIIRQAQATQPVNEIELIIALLQAYLDTFFGNHKGSAMWLLDWIESHPKLSIDEIKKEILLVRIELSIHSTTFKPLCDFMIDTKFHWFLAPHINRQLNCQSSVSVTKHSMFAVEKVDLNEYLARENLAFNEECLRYGLL